MFRSLFVYLSKSTFVKNIFSRWSVAWKTASRFVAGEDIDKAVSVIRELNKKGIQATIDHLGENTKTETDANNATNEIINILETIDKNNIKTNVSIKLTQIGLNIDYLLCRNNLMRILNSAKDTANFVRIDMEDAGCLPATIKLFNEMSLEQGFRCVGLVIQSYLYRSVEDMTKLLEEGSRIRLCKGAYKEPADVAYPKKRDVDANYDKLVRLMMDSAIQSGSSIISGDGKIPPQPAIATHDEHRIKNAIAYATQINLPKNAFEFQMLYGIRRDLQEKLVAEGFQMRVYVPYGTEWYPYFTRRLAERPANLWFLISNFFRK